MTSLPRVASLLLVLSLVGSLSPAVRLSHADARSPAASNLRLSQPVSLAVARSGDVYVLDWASPHIDRISPGGALLAAWPVAPVIGVTPGHIAVDGAGNVYALRNVRHGKIYVGAITRYAPTGRALATWFNSAWLNATGIAARNVGTLYVLLPGSRSEQTSPLVLTVSRAGTIAGRWYLSRYGYDFLEALSIAVDTHGTLYVSGFVGSCSRGCQGADANVLVRRAPSGPKRIRTWMSGIPAGFGVAADGAGNVYLVEDYTLWKLSPSGQVTSRWGRVGCGPLAFRALTGLGIDGQSNLYLLDAGNTTIQKVSTAGQPEAIWGTCPPSIPPTPILPTPKPNGAAWRPGHPQP